jgi:hypothetical protein
MEHAAPAAGILCIALTGSELSLRLRGEKRIAGMQLSRSSIIQQLSILIRFLDWVGPSQPNGDLAKNVKKVIRHVLDQALNGNVSAESFHFGPSDCWSDFGSFDLLNTFDWIRNDISLPTEWVSIPLEAQLDLGE